jgi:cyclase
VLKVRIIPTLLYRDFGLVKGVRFDSQRAVGGAMQAVKVYNLRGVDELVFLDVRATIQGRPPDFELIDELADECFMPLTVGGGVRTLDQVQGLLRVGADKVSVNSAAVEDPSLVRLAADRFGSQCIVVSIDCRTAGDGSYRVCTRSGTVQTDLLPEAFASRMEEFGAGEILLTAVDRDGTMEGYDVELIRRVVDSVSIPVIASGGAGSYQHMEAALAEGGAMAVAAAAMFHFTEQTPAGAREYLGVKGFPVRS